jgi:hypothetical protein
MATAAYVTQQYQELLGRAPDAGGLKHYMGYSNPAEVRTSILGSAEYRARQAAAAQPAQAAPSGPTAAQLAEQERQKWNTEVDNKYNQVGQFDASAKNPLDMYNAALEKLGIGDARTRVSGLRESLLNTENLIRNVEGDVSARTAESLVNENQKRRLVTMEQQPLAQRAADEGRNLEVALADYKDIMAEGKATTEMEYQFQKDQRAALMERLQVAIGQAKNADDRARWQTEYDRLVAKDAEETRRWNAEMQLERDKFAFEQSEAAAARAAAARSSSSSSSSSGGSSSAKKPTAGETKISVQQKIYANLRAVKGADNFVSPNSWTAAKHDWVASGYSSAEFDKIFGLFRNPTHGGYN